MVVEHCSVCCLLAAALKAEHTDSVPGEIVIWRVEVPDIQPVVGVTGCECKVAPDAALAGGCALVLHSFLEVASVAEQAQAQYKAAAAAVALCRSSLEKLLGNLSVTAVVVVPVAVAVVDILPLHLRNLFFEEKLASKEPLQEQSFVLAPLDHISQ